jgi:hypothetical protein
MSQYGYLVFYTCERPLDPRRHLRELLRELAIERAFAAYQTIDEDRSWDALQRSLGNGSNAPDEQGVEYHDVRELGPDELVALFSEGRCLTLDIGPRDPGLGDRVEAAVRSYLPQDIRANFLPGSLYIRIGYHDLFECVEHETGLLIARPFLSVEFFGYGTPGNWPAARELIFKIPEIVAVKEQLARVLGPLEEFAYWRV